MSLLNSSITESLEYVYLEPETYSDFAHANASVVSWAAIFAGATAAAVFSLILLILGTGLGLSSISPWTHEGIRATSLGISAIVWITVTQVFASGLGGYLVGRLRTKWAGVHTDEVYFRDTAHGFLCWGVATLVTAAFLSSAIGSFVSGAAQASAGLAGGITTALRATGSGTTGTQVGKHQNGGDASDNAMGYFVDSLFRQGPDNTASTSSSAATPATTPTTPVPVSEVTRIFVNAAGKEELPMADVSYLGQLVSNHTGLSRQEAEMRVDETYANMLAKKNEAEMKAKEVANQARKATAYASLWLFASFLMGAFSASCAATYGGRSRDS